MLPTIEQREEGGADALPVISQSHGKRDKLWFPLDANSNTISHCHSWTKRALGMSMQPVYSRRTRAIVLGALIIFPAVFCASCSTVGGTGGQSGRATASKSTDPSKDKAADRRRWAERVERDNQLAPSGSAPGSYGSSRPLFTW